MSWHLGEEVLLLAFPYVSLAHGKQASINKQQHAAVQHL